MEFSVQAESSFLEIQAQALSGLVGFYCEPKIEPSPIGLRPEPVPALLSNYQGSHTDTYLCRNLPEFKTKAAKLRKKREKEAFDYFILIPNEFLKTLTGRQRPIL